ncbi:hypothetical protein ORI20_07925 [Mycobacterium sp. CVI_P3]|uniref:Polyketide synthase n=1 Tax=Mycobacterium pinniadriaticum TaxID=2994102 RepID=A0ABT3SB72_9MYCO|nr:hypothetical protein [Mycobacterium pinniadriaticum]MCX2930198.1 hypothetical protein [Mycobacterium pinniadriaticum]MCX2936740.1 hypothetical protein [Mycobacterium pinniadriaticum]
MVAPVTYPSSNVRVVDDEIPGRPGPQDLVRLSAPLSPELTAELDGATEATGLGVEDVLLAALGRAIARTIGVGFVTVSGLTTVQPVRLCCADERGLDADALLADVRAALTPARQLGTSAADVMFSFLGLPPDPSLGPLQLADGPALGVLAYRTNGVLWMDWWFDDRRLDRCTVEELTAQFRLGLIGLTSEASSVAGTARIF